MSMLLPVLFGLYGILILAFATGFKRLKEFMPDSMPAVNSFSILVVFRNEIENLQGLIDSLKSLDYPRDRFEILLMDDDSGDGSLEMALELQAANSELSIKVLENGSAASSPKKEAIEKGVEKARFDWILTTDADCRLQRKHLLVLDRFIQQKEPVLVAGPVICEADDSLLQKFQLLDFLSLQGSTMGSFGIHRPGSLIRPFMCNGANLCYSRKAFKECGGYQGNRHIASGDDVFLLEKMLARDPAGTLFLKSAAAVVSTRPKDSWKGLLQQRTRWAAKTSSTGSLFGKGLGFLVLLTNLGLVLGLALATTGLLDWTLLGMLFLVKINLDFLLIHRTAAFFGRTEALRSFLASSLIYPFFVLFVSLSTLRGSYHWKGRSHKK